MSKLCCIKCGSETIAHGTRPEKIDEEINQVLIERQTECASCGHFTILKWWEVWNNGVKIISPVEGFAWRKEDQS